MNEAKPKTHQEAAPSTLWALWSQAPVPHEVIDLPVGENSPLGRMGAPQLAVVPLSVEEVMLCQAEADDYAKKTLKMAPKEGEQNEAYKSIYDKEVTLRVLWRACRDIDDANLVRRVFPGPKQMRLQFTPDQLSVLALHYVRAERLLSPIRDESMTKEELDAIIEKLRVGGKAFPLDWMGSGLLRDLAWRLVSRLTESASASGSAGSPPEESASHEAPDPTPPEEPLALEATDEAPGEGAPEEVPPTLWKG